MKHRKFLDELYRQDEDAIADLLEETDDKQDAKKIINYFKRKVNKMKVEDFNY